MCSAVLVLPHDAPRDEWLAARRDGIGASEIAAVMGISPWDSPFSLWWRKHMGWEIADNPEMAAGRRLEPVIADWFADQAPGVYVTRSGLFRASEREWQLCTPDRELHLHECGVSDYPIGLLECKAAFSWEGWGEEGTSEIPVHYKAQGLWQLDVFGLDAVHFAAFAGLHFRRYLIRRDEKDLRMMREAGRRFMESLTEGEPPDVDSHTATLSTLRRAHPYIEDKTREIPAKVADGFRRAKRFAELADVVERRYAARVRAHLGTAKTATCGGTKVAARTSDDKLRSYL